ncbi:hypothetical protein [Rubellimicrobium thermophilum]|uniref:hypothetical protein n=1 Tax=Rubellimicrobium thermophilum TaxID=295419 RepID=UPI00041DA25E|nr:hypothetical protein [Rubellimicrobium thermophilum]
MLGEALLGQRIALDLDGSLALAGGEGEARITARLVEGGEGALEFAGSYSNSTRILALDLDLSEAPGGLAARTLGLPGLPSVDLRIAGTPPSTTTKPPSVWPPTDSPASRVPLPCARPIAMPQARCSRAPSAWTCGAI